MKNTIKAEWGIETSLPATACWGARAIFKDGYVDCLYDRQGGTGDIEELSVLVQAMNEMTHRGKGSKYSGSAFHLAKAKATRLYATGLIKGSEEKRVVLYEDAGGLRIEANTNGSCGYLYMVVYFKDGHHVYLEHRNPVELIGVSAVPDSPVKLTQKQELDLQTIALVEFPTQAYMPRGFGVTKRELGSFIKRGLITEKHIVTPLGHQVLNYYKKYGR